MLLYLKDLVWNLFAVAFVTTPCLFRTVNFVVAVVVVVVVPSSFLAVAFLVVVVVVVIIVVVVVVIVMIFMILVLYLSKYDLLTSQSIQQTLAQDPRLCLNIYIVNVLCNMDKDVEERLLRPTREQTAIVVGVLYVSPMLVLQSWDLMMLSSNWRYHDLGWWWWWWWWFVTAILGCQLCTKPVYICRTGSRLGRWWSFFSGKPRWIWWDIWGWNLARIAMSSWRPSIFFVKGYI